MVIHKYTHKIREGEPEPYAPSCAGNEFVRPCRMKMVSKRERDTRTMMSYALLEEKAWSSRLGEERGG